MLVWSNKRRFFHLRKTHFLEAIIVELDTKVKVPRVAVSPRSCNLKRVIFAEREFVFETKTCYLMITYHKLSALREPPR